MFLKTLNVCIGGDKDHLAQVVRTLQKSSIPVAAVRDGDMPDNAKDNIFKLPGTKAPEKELFESPNVITWISDGLSVQSAEVAAAIQGRDHHEWINVLAEIVCRSKESLLHDLAATYVNGLPETETSSLVALLKAAVDARPKS